MQFWCRISCTRCSPGNSFCGCMFLTPAKLLWHVCFWTKLWPNWNTFHNRAFSGIVPILHLFVLHLPSDFIVLMMHILLFLCICLQMFAMSWESGVGKHNGSWYFGREFQLCIFFIIYKLYILDKSNVRKFVKILLPEHMNCNVLDWILIVKSLRYAPGCQSG